MPLPARFLDELRARLPLSSFINQHVPLQRAGREWRACCPFHKEKSPSFYVNDLKGFYHCFGCGAHGDVIGFAMQHLRWDFPETVENLARLAGLPVPARTQETRAEQDSRNRLYSLCDAAAAFFSRQLFLAAGKSALTYLQQRALTEETIAAWRLGYAPDDSKALINALQEQGYRLEEMLQVGLVRRSERNAADAYSFFRGRVMFPVTDSRDRVVAFGARLLAGDGPKYINSPEHALFKKGELLFGAAHARRLDEQQPLVLAEGYMDVIAMQQAGFAGVAPLGTALTEMQLAALWRHAASRTNSTPILSFDGDSAGIRAAARALHLALPHLSADRTLDFLFLPQGEDPDSLIRKRGGAAFGQALQQTLPLFEVLWQQAVAGKAINSPEDKAALEKALAQAVAPLKDPHLKKHYEREIKNRLWQLFNPRHKGFATSGPNSHNQHTKRPETGGGAILPLARAGTLDPWYLRANVVLATLINYPELLAEAEDWLLETAIAKDSVQELIRKNLLQALLDLGASLDAEGLNRYLQQRCGSAAVSSILSEATYKHAGFARPDRSLTEARLGWLDLQQTYILNRMRDDMQAVGRDLADTFDETSLTRMLSLQAELSRMPDVLADGTPMGEPDRDGTADGS